MSSSLNLEVNDMELKLDLNANGQSVKSCKRVKEEDVKEFPKKKVKTKEEYIEDETSLVKYVDMTKQEIGENISIENPIESESTTGRRRTESNINTDEMDYLQREKIQLKENERQQKAEDMKKIIVENEKQKKKLSKMQGIQSNHPINSGVNETGVKELVAVNKKLPSAEVKLPDKREAFKLMKYLVESLNPEDLLEENEALKTKNVELTAKFTTVESKAEKLERKLSHYYKKAKTAEAEIKRLKKEITELTEKNTNLEVDRNAKTEEVDSTIAQFYEIESDYRKKVETTEADNNRLRNENKELTEKKAIIETELKTKTAAFQHTISLFKRFDPGETEKILQENETLKSKNVELTEIYAKNLRHHNKISETADVEVKKLKKEKVELTEKCAKHETELETQNNEIKQTISMMMSLNPEDMQKMVEENETLKMKIFELTVKSTNVEANLAANTLKLQSMNSLLGSINPTDMQKMVEENQTLKKEVVEFTRRYKVIYHSPLLTRICPPGLLDSDLKVPFSLLFNLPTPAQKAQAQSGIGHVAGQSGIGHEAGQSGIGAVGWIGGRGDDGEVDDGFGIDHGGPERFQNRMW